MSNLQVIIATNTVDNNKHRITQKCIDTLWEYSSSNKNEIIIVDSQYNKSNDFNYRGAISIYTNEPFEHRAYHNIGYEFLKERSMFNAEFILLAYDNLVFHNSWFDPLIRAINSGYDSVSPKSIGSKLHYKFENIIYEGWGNEFTPWCLLFKASSLDKLMPLCNNGLINKMKNMNMKHALIGNAFVTHTI